MEQTALKYADEKSNKFWHAEKLECEFAVNWGKSGTRGRWQIKEFSSSEQCEKELNKLIQSKRKKGYTDDKEFSFDNAIYFDTEDYGLHKLTSHPIFRKYFSDDIYYNCFDEETPFGSDTGNDTLRFLEETYVKKGSKTDFKAFPEYLVKDIWELTYYPIENLSEEAFKKLIETPKDGLSADDEIMITNQVILATAFGQIKITGKADSGLLDMALASLDRTDMIEKILLSNGGQPSEITAKMRKDLMKFKENTNNAV